MTANLSRYMVVFLFALAVVASGCTTDTASNPQESGETGDTPDASPSESESEPSGPADISLKSLNVTDEVEMGEDFTIRATFENTGGQTGEFRTTVMARGQDAETFSSTEETIEGEVPAGSEKPFEATLTATGISNNEIKLAGTEATDTVRIVPKRVDVGEEYTTSDDIGITVTSVELAEYYTYEDYMGDEALREPESGQYVFVDLKTQNKADSPQSLPTSYDFQLIANNRQYEGSTILMYEPLDRGDTYEGGEVQPGIVREGYILFEVPSDVEKDDISVVWNEVISLTEKSVYWTA